MVLSLTLLSPESLVSVKESPNRKKKFSGEGGRGEINFWSGGGGWAWEEVRKF